MRVAVFSLFVLLLGIVGLASAADDTAAKTEDTVEEMKLSAKPIKSVSSILAKTDINFTSEFTPARLEDGCILPSSGLSIKKSGEPAEVSIGEKKLSFVSRGEDVEYSFDGSKGKNLRKVSGDYPALKLKGDDGARFSVGFPAIHNNRTGAYLYYRSAHAMRGKIGVDEIYLYDNNFDLKYDRENDVYTLGKGIVYAPLTAKIATGKNIIEIAEISVSGECLKYKEYVPEHTGTFSIQFKGSNLDAHMAIESEDGELSFVDQGRERKTTLPVGKYKLSYGLVYAQKEKKVAAIMLPTPKMEHFDVSEGNNKKITIGTDISLIFKVYREGKKIRINGWETSLEGRDGERYYCFNVIGEPEVAVRISSKKKKKMYRLGSFCLT